MSESDSVVVGEIDTIVVSSYRRVETFGDDDPAPEVFHTITVDLGLDDTSTSPSKTMTQDEALKLASLLIEAAGHGMKRKLMPLGEFVEEGFLQEANRQFFHPVGLALEYWQFEGGALLGGIWDYREDPEGMAFGPGVLSTVKAESVVAERRRHVEERIRLWGVVVQPFTEERAKPGETP